jgi:oligoribonuclease NrnB/cAMP/cGMP phosphodiesterase (DHH superfamily)
MEKSICFYHQADYDGRCSAAIINLIDKGTKFVGMDHPAREVNFDNIDEDTTVYLVDFSFDTNTMKLLKNETKRFVWIDHHITAIDRIKEEVKDIEGIQSTENAACIYTWNYFFPDKTLPSAIRLIGEYDIWNHADDRAVPLNLGLQLYQNSYKPYSTDFWRRLFFNRDFLSEIINKGRIIDKFNFINDNKIANICAKETTFNGYNVIAINKPLSNSLVFNSVWDETKYDFEIVYYRHKSGIWKVSLYNPSPNNKINLGKIAESYGGGGHFSACSFTCETLPFPI